jgi:predicted nicotinamide N-methyase
MNGMRRVSPTEFVLATTRPRRPPFVPELLLHLADEPLELWADTQRSVEHDVPPPFWAFVWAGGQALARHLLDHPELVAGRHVVDVATGSGLVAVAAARAGAASVTAYDVDDLAVAATRLNARLNHVRVDAATGQVAEIDAGEGTLVTAGDVFYDEKMARVFEGALRRLRDSGAQVLVGDPRRAYLPAQGMQQVASYDVEVEDGLEDSAVKTTVVAALWP